MEALEMEANATSARVFTVKSMTDKDSGGMQESQSFQHRGHVPSVGITRLSGFSVGFEVPKYKKRYSCFEFDSGNNVIHNLIGSEFKTNFQRTCYYFKLFINIG